MRNTRIVQSLYFLKPKFQASGHLVWLYSPVCVGPDRKPKDRFSHNEAQCGLNKLALSRLCWSNKSYNSSKILSFSCFCKVYNYLLDVIY